jgi:ankyrin repeat protein
VKSENKKKDFYYDCDAFNILFTICGCSKDKDKDISKKQLYTFICNLNMQGVKEALKNHAEFAKETIKTSSKTKPLELAVREIESEKVQLQICSQLIKSGADVNEKGDEITALKGTVSRIPFENYNEKMDMLNRLLESGAKPDSDIVSFLLNDDNSNWGMQYYFTPQILKKLEKYDGKQNISQGLRAAMNGDDHKLQKLVISDKINKKDKEQVLAFAAAHCNVDTLKIMRKQGYDFSWKDSDKVGLLQIAALCNHSSVVKYLLEQQLDSKAKADYYKVRAVDFAIVAGNLDKAKILIEKDKVNFKKNHHGKPCDVWEFILAFGDKKSFKTLESLGHQPTKEEIYDTYQNYGYEQGIKVKEDELQEIIWNGESDIARKILENKMTKGKVRKEYLLQTAVDIGDYTMVRYLVEQGADINKYVKEETENYSSTALQTACASQSQEILKYLKKHGGDSKKKDSEGRSCKKIAKDNKAVWNLELIQ